VRATAAQARNRGERSVARAVRWPRRAGLARDLPRPRWAIAREGVGLSSAFRRFGLLGAVPTPTLACPGVSRSRTWTEAFKHFFPLPDELTVLQEASAAEIAKRAIIVPEVLVEVTLPGSGKSYTLKNSATNVPKDSKLNFELENYGELPANSQVVWTVRNQGKHAEALNDLGHFSGFGKRVGPETAEYAGRHYMDVTIHSGGRTIGMRRVPVTVINASLVAKTRRLFSNRKR
jgi:hypothetical protein